MYIDVTELFFFSFSVILNISIIKWTQINAKCMSRNQKKGGYSKTPKTKKSEHKSIL